MQSNDSVEVLAGLHVINYKLGSASAEHDAALALRQCGKFNWSPRIPQISKTDR